MFLYYTFLESTYKTLIVLDKHGSLYYSSLGKSQTELLDTMVSDFDKLKKSNLKVKYQLKPLSKLESTKEIQQTIHQFEEILIDSSLLKNNSLKIEFIFGTPNQRKLWNKLLNIEYGEIRHYNDLAKELNTSSRVIGNACGSNKLAIVVPCHRVVAKSGKITGYRYGIEIKKHLLKSELKDNYNRLICD